MTTTLTIDGTERTFAHADTVSVSIHNGAAHASCTSCRRGEYLPRGIKHSSRCGDDNGQAVEAVATPAASAVSRPSSRADARAIHAAAKAGTIGSIATDDEVYDLVRSGHMSADDAMNRDF
jgi:hypothetical protein